jgi:predicted nucleotidyltransferase
MNPQVHLDRDSLAEFCRKWRIRELSLFGSALRDDFGPDSDLDFLVSFEPEAGWDLFDLIAMKEELENRFGRRVDLVEKEALRNPWRRYESENPRVLYRPDAEDMARLLDCRMQPGPLPNYPGRRQEELLSIFVTRRRGKKPGNVCVAARHVSEATRIRLPGIPWTSIIGLRNVIAHEYGEILHEKVWGICINRLPALIRQIEQTGVENHPPIEEP